MSKREGDLLQLNESDAIDSYFECITECSLDQKGMECITQCVEVHLKKEDQ
ncbi:hypothetical protein EV11_0687 [Prochlorococcus sp. SS52]|uniref:hypothetical protein n=1 Tax=Prochlorococcus marinus TaxID=1219 RepID=UPI0002D34CB8|nr:hypothetical protein [Prochlorococcus marinus]KGG11279.1 hypothetical protein EV04_1356 [Prochlorococcus marinus str. LG]KGG33747.1 hypothetical protein EV10_0183 [Prochlorococcus marinus str. SS51]KGG36902.1 hypothetical protein EV11_0687 [Prochlorococcus sp. SS52]KGG21618.1 hypothetical protein EV08_0708 [Prochlorococcus marinus str. SS2]KGG23040.1 hypothetical protein EV09_1784 [Prochlorococcus marinus str. SS35]